MRIVLDTNVFVSSFFGGNPRKVIDLWREGLFTLCLSKDILEEYVEILGRLKCDQEVVRELLSLFAKGRHTLFTAKTSVIKVVEEDPDDDKFIECAVALKADMIVSGDKALLSVKDYMGIKIVSPRAFLDEIK